MVCNKCGNEISGESKLCPECGNAINSNARKIPIKYFKIAATIIPFIILIIVVRSVSSNSKYGAVEIEKARFTCDLYRYDYILIVVYNYKNTTNNSASFAEFCTTKAYQDGIECKATTADAFGFENFQELNEVQPGHSYQLFMAYKLNNSDKTVNVIVSDNKGHKIAEKFFDPDY